MFISAYYQGQLDYVFISAYYQGQLDYVFISANYQGQLDYVFISVTMSLQCTDPNLSVPIFSLSLSLSLTPHDICVQRDISRTHLYSMQGESMREIPPNHIRDRNLTISIHTIPRDAGVAGVVTRNRLTPYTQYGALGVYIHKLNLLT